MTDLSCPVCKSSLREVDRAGITIDVCTQCRGVWLDRGELEKLSEVLARGEPQRRPDPDWGARPTKRRDDERARFDDDDRYKDVRDDDDDDRRWQRNREQPDRYKKSGMARLLDFFD